MVILSTDTTMPKNNYRPYYRRKLPHVHPSRAQYFVTFRLTNSLPVTVANNLRHEFQDLLYNSSDVNRELHYRFFHAYFNAFDQLIDSSRGGSQWLKIPEIAQCVIEAMQYHDGKSYHLIAYTVMSNHVHMLFNYSKEKTENSIPVILQSIKKYSARKANTLLKRTGKSFWQSESYDHVVKSKQETENVIKYILFNPVKAGLCKEWFEWKWSYIREEYKEYLK